MAYRIAEGYVEVSADQAKYDRDIAKLKTGKLEVKALLKLDDARYLTQLAKLTRDQHISVLASLSAKTYLTQLDRITRDQTVQVTAVLKADKYLTQLERITRDQQIKATITLDDAAVKAKLAALGAAAKVNISPQMSDADVAKVEADLKRITRDRRVRVWAFLDANQYFTQLDRITRDQVVNIRADLNANAYLTQLDRITREQRLRVTAELNSGGYSAELARLTRNRRVRVDVDMDRSALSGLSGVMSRIGGSAGGSGGGLGILSSRIVQIGAAALGALPTLASLGQAIVAMAPAAAVAAPALASLGSIFGALKVGMGGVGDAFKAAFDTSTSSANAAVARTKAVESAKLALARASRSLKETEQDAARSIADAQGRVKEAVQGVRDAEVAAAADRKAALDKVRQAERDLADAQRAELKAQQDLTQARKEAKQELEDLANQLADAHLNEREDVLAVQDAETNLAAVKAKGAAASAEELAKAQLAYDQAVQRLKEQQTETARLEEKNKEAAKAGVDGSRQVTDAQDRVTAAHRNTGDAAKAVGDAQAAAAKVAADGARSILDAETKLADAQQGVRDAQVQAYRQVRGAQEAVADAARALADAQTQGSTATDKLAQAMAKLSPNARAFVDAVRSLKPAWDALRLDVQDRLFAGLGEKLKSTATSVLPVLREGLAGTAGWLNTVAKNAMSAVDNLAKTGTLKAVFAGVNAGLQPLAKVPAQLVTGFGQLAAAASPAFLRLTTAVGNAVSRIADKLSAAFADGRLTSAINSAVDLAIQFGHLLADVFATVKNVMDAAAAGGGNALGVLGSVFAELRRVTSMPEVKQALTSIFQAVNAVGKVFATTLGAVLQAALPILAAIAPVVTALANALGPVLKQLASALGQAIMPIVRALLPVVLMVGRALIQVVSALTPLLKPIGDLIAAVVRALAPALRPIVDIIVGIVRQLSGPLAQIIKSLTPVIRMFGDLFAQVFEELRPLIKPVLDVVGALARMFAGLFKTALMGVMDAIKPLIPVVVKLVDMFVRLMLSVIKPLTPIINQLARQFGEFLGKEMKALTPVIEKIADSMLKLLPQFEPLIPAITNLAIETLKLLPKFMDLALKVLPPLLDVASKLAVLLVEGLAWGLQKVLPLVVEVITQFTNFHTSVVKIVGGALKWVADRFQWLYDVLVGHSIIPDLVNSIVGWFTRLWTNTARIFGEIKKAIVDTWNRIWSNVRDTWNSAWARVSGGISGAWAWLRTQFANVKNSITSTWSGMWNTVSGKVSSVFSSIKSKVSQFKTNVQDAFGRLRDSIGTLWGKVTDKVKGPVAWVIQHVYTGGIKRMWDTIADKVGLPHLPAVSAKFARGGVVPGTGTGDTVPAMLTPGERVLSLGQVDRLGGHRGIDALLGEDRKSHEGGNPRPGKKAQAPGYASGGIIGSIKDIGSSVVHGIASGVSWVKDLVVGGLKAAAQKAISSLVRPLINSIPGGGTALGGLMRGIPNKALDGILNWFGNEDKKAEGGPAVQNALGWARTQAGLPYQWAGNGNPSWDCSGLMSAIESVIRGESPHRRWATGAFSGSAAPSGWVHNMQSPFMIGITNAGVGHTAGTIAGVNVESRGGAGVVVGSGARGYSDSLFTDRYGFAPAAQYDSGGLLQPGATLAVNRTGRPEAVLTAEEHEAFRRLIAGVGGGGVTIGAVNIDGTWDLSSASERKRAAQAMVAEIKEALRQYDRGRAR